MSSIVRSTVAANIILPFLATGAVALRFHARHKKSDRLHSDDWTVLGALVPSIVVCVLGLYAAAAGLIGADLATVTFAQVISYKKLLFAGMLLVHFVFGLVKISAVLLYKRIFDVKSFRIVSNVMLFIVSVWMIVAFFIVIFCARGVSSFWQTPTFDEGTQYVLRPAALVISMSVINITLDLAVMVLPIPVIGSLNLSLKRKIYLSSVFFLGAFCLVSSGVRLYWARQLYFLSNESRDQFKVIDNNQIWANVEANMSVLTTCLPTIYTIFRDSRASREKDVEKGRMVITRKISWTRVSVSK